MRLVQYMRSIMKDLSKRTQAELSMLMVAFIWGTSFVVVKNALQDISPFIFLGLRFLLAFITLAILAYNDFKHINSKTIGHGFLLGFFLLLGYGFQTVGLQYTTASNAGFITSISVVLVPVIHAFFGGPRPSWKMMFCVFMAGMGLFLIVFQYQSYQLNYGDLLILLCSLGFAFHLVFVGIYAHLHSPITITGIQLLLVGIVCLTTGLAFESWPQYFSSLSVVSILATSLLATSLAFLTQNLMQRYSTPTRFALILTAEPVFTAVAAHYWALEQLTIQGWMGAGLILAAMLISIATRTEEPVIEANI